MAIYQSACTYSCKHVELVAHQVENRLNSVLTTKIRLPNTHTVANPDSLKNEAGLRHQSVIPEDRHCNSASAKGMVAHEICPKPSQNASCWQSRERWLGQIRLSHNTFWPCPPAHHTKHNDLLQFGLWPKGLTALVLLPPKHQGRQVCP